MIPIPPIAIKAIAGLGIVALAYGAGWLKCNKANRAEYEAQLNQQIAKAAQSQYELQAVLAQFEELRLKHNEQQAVRIEYRDREVVKYVKGPAKKCAVSPELERAHDELTRLHDAVPSPDRLPTTTETASESDESPKSGLPNASGDSGQAIDDSVTLEAYGLCLEAYSGLRSTYDLLSAWTWQTYEAQMRATGHGE